ncbi:uncharacterized protein LOC131994675 [Stomoxys calcitrans]|uniref:uncharacterized protein LOC131994675 n=1 Tax=Stomoxys calcitrans TaxID=35570 RepID=UPI0027E30F4B|nr:uncharacterized protein LOC131994675 [Stomoxys calcitrans]
MSNRSSRIEYLFLELLSDDKKRLLLGCVYRPNSSIDFEELIETIDIISIEYDNIIVAGDFNSNLLVERCLADSMQTLGLLPVNDSAPTHFTRSNASLLDVFFVSHLSKISLYNQLDAPAFSKHDLLFVTYHFEINPTVCTSTYRDFKNIDWPLLHQSLDEVPWEEIFYMEGVDEQVSFLNHNLCSIYDTCVPVKVIYTNRKQQPWFTPEIKHLISVRNLAYKRWKRYRLPTLYDTFKSARRDVLKKTNESKKQYYKRKFENAIDSKRKWKEIRNIGIGSKSNTNTDCLSISDLDEINENFLKINTVDPGTNTYSNISTAQIEDTFSFRCVSPEEVLQSFATIKSDAMGFDGIHPRFAKLVLPKILPFVTHIYNNILTKSTFPTDWKLAKIIPIPKQNSEFRPIAILPFFSKALERIINTQIDAFLSFRGLLNDRQSGFRTKRNCSTVLIDVVEELRQNMDNNMVSFLVLLDHSKAFDTVNHDILISKLDRLFFFSKPACKLISSYITGRRQSVNVGDTTSAALDVPRGVPQGSILGPLLFSVYINDLPDIPMHCNVQMYADDVQLFSSAKPNCVQSCINNINCDLNEIQNWASKNSLCLNPSKTKLMKILKRSTTQIPPVRATLNNSVIETVDTSCNLGVIFNSKLTWTNHINKAVGKVQGMLRSLWSVRTSTPFQILEFGQHFLSLVTMENNSMGGWPDAQPGKTHLRTSFNTMTIIVVVDARLALHGVCVRLTLVSNSSTSFLIILNHQNRHSSTGHTSQPSEDTTPGNTGHHTHHRHLGCDANANASLHHNTSHSTMCQLHCPSKCNCSTFAHPHKPTERGETMQHSLAMASDSSGSYNDSKNKTR